MIAALGVLTLVIAATGIAYAFMSPGNPGAPGPNTITWSGQGAQDGAVETVACGADDTPNGTADEAYLHWILETDAGSATDIVLHLDPGGENPPSEYTPVKHSGNAWHFDTPYFTPDDQLDADATLDVAEPGTGTWNLTISHGCEGDGRDEDPPLEVTHTATGTATTSWTWAVAKTVEPEVVHAVGGTKTDVGYSVAVTHDTGTTTYLVTGVITITNPNAGDATGVHITPTVNNGGTCAVTGGGEDLTIGPGEHTYDYACTYGQPPDSPSITSAVAVTVTVWWPSQPIDGATLDEASAESTSEAFAFTPVSVDDCVAAVDAFNGAGVLATDPGKVCATDPSPTTISYTRSVPATSNTCTTYDNTATITTDDTTTVHTASASVEVCGDVTGGLTIGYWQNKNGQNLIKSANASGVCSLTATLRDYAPFTNLSPTATCTQVASYVSGVVKAASATGASMNAMLKAQMLATALDVWQKPALGSTPVDLTLICRSVSSCSTPEVNPAQYYDTSSVFGNPPAGDCQTVSALLSVASSQANAGGATWFGNQKATQEMAKNTFDTINNGKAWAC